MAIDAATVRKVARLSRIAVPEDRLEPLAREIDGIVNWIEQLSEVDTDGVEPMTSVVHQPLPMREDVVTAGGGRLAAIYEISGDTMKVCYATGGGSRPADSFPSCRRCDHHGVRGAQHMAETGSANCDWRTDCSFVRRLPTLVDAAAVQQSDDIARARARC